MARKQVLGIGSVTLQATNTGERRDRGFPSEGLRMFAALLGSALREWTGPSRHRRARGQVLRRGAGGAWESFSWSVSECVWVCVYTCTMMCSFDSEVWSCADAACFVVAGRPGVSGMSWQFVVVASSVSSWASLRFQSGAGPGRCLAARGRHSVCGWRLGRRIRISGILSP